MFTLDEFKFKWIPTASVVLVLCTPDKNKVLTVREMMYHKRHIPKGIVLSGANDSTGEYSTIVPLSCIFNEWNADRVESILKFQSKAISKSRKELEDDDDDDADGRSLKNAAFIMIDDMTADSRKWNATSTINKLFGQGVNLNMFIMLATPQMKSVNPTVRGTIEYVVLFDTENRNTLKSVHSEWCGTVIEFKPFLTLFQKYTADGCCLVIVSPTKAKSKKLKDRIFWYKAKKRGSFRIGHPSYWKNFYDTFRC